MTIDVPPTVSAVPHVDQYIGVWAMHEDSFRAAAESVRAMNLVAHVSKAMPIGGQADAPAYSVVDGVAIVDVAGMMTKYGSSFSQMSDGTLGRRKAIRKAVGDDAVKAIVLRVDSPGGSVSGTGDLADEVARAAKKKPVWAYIEDMGASAAYWVASQASRVIANPSAIVGSIGVYSVIYDVSEQAAAEGIKVHVVKAGEFKGAGEPGTEVTDDQLAEFQRTVNALNAVFVDAVARGRGMSAEQAKAVADGRVHIGAAAMKHRLVDAVQSFDEAVAALRRQIGAGLARSSQAVAQRESTMDETKETTSPAATATATTTAKHVATTAELRAAFPGADAEFREQCREANATIEQAGELWKARCLAKRESDLEAREKAATAKEKELAAKASEKPRVGVDPAPTGNATSEGDGNTGDAKAAWESAVQAEMKNGKTRQQAVSSVTRNKPEIHAAYVRAHNEKHGRQLGRFE